ncbi:MAG: hypothetical protein M3537_09325 [Chloroflexota bacterium]|nr:hypothetical protein [Chloroflexota bacterium]
MTYPFGQTVIPRLTFRDRDKALVAVTSISVAIQPPLSAPYTYTGPFDNPSIGVYEFLIDASEEGIWKGEATGSITGDGSAVTKFWFCVDPEYVMVGS